ncbi:MAG: EAL domain-containing protein, partial [Eubacteriales bacterium]
MAFLTGISIAVIILRSIKYAGLTVWAISFVFIILSVIFSKRVLIILSSFILFANIWMWAKVPYKTVYVDGVHHFLRICICILALWLAFYVNQVYIKRLKENEDQIMFQKMISQISTQFVTVTQANLDEKIKEMLKLCGDYYQMDRTYLFLSSEDEKTMTYSYEWCNEGIEPAIDIIKEVPTDAFPWCMKQTLNNDVNHLPDVEILKIQSLISIPVTNNGKILGFLGFDIAHKEDYLRNDYQDMFKVLANLLADALVKIATEKEINYMAYYDALTGLPNRTLFKNRLEQEIYLVKRTEKLIGLIFIDLDSFKSVNDTMGHEGGDDLLKQVACRFSECVRKHDTISRFGGDEFLIMLTNISSVGDIHKIANNIISVFNQPLKINNQEFFITSSAGIAIYPADGENAEELIKNADLAMYSSKEKGKNQYTLCSPVMKENVLEKTQLTNNLYRAQEKNELVLYYQPQVDITTKEIIGLEALIRWNHPSLGMISPCTFIPLAEQTGLINTIGEWVLQTACRQNKKWQDMGLTPLRMAVNLSIKQFHYSSLVNLVAKTLNETGLEPKYLELEITESTAVKESNYIIGILQELKELGVTIAIDDFGTEYSSLNRLKLLPIDRLKIDMQFVHNIAEGNKDEAIAKVIIQLAKNLNLDVIAEGVETKSQYEFFNKHLCDEVQGY